MKKDCYNCALYYEEQHHEKCNSCVITKDADEPSEWIEGPHEVASQTQYERIISLSPLDLAVELASIQADAVGGHSHKCEKYPFGVFAFRAWLETEVDK